MKRSQTNGKLPTGIEALHQRGCADPRPPGKCDPDNTSSCDCRPTYRAAVYDKRTKSRIRETFATLATSRIVAGLSREGLPPADPTGKSSSPLTFLSIARYLTRTAAV